MAQLPEIARRAVPRLSALIFGIADHAADLGLPTIDHRHPVAQWAQAMIVDVAGAAGVPAIDAMTLDYPVANPALDAAANRRQFLDRMRLVYDEASRARELGMLGKWVGHPAQLFGVLLEFDAAFDAESLEIEARKLEAYRSSVEDGRGAMMIDGVMSDRATDRHARWEDVRLVATVFAGDTLYAESEVLEVRASRSRPGQGIVRVRTRGYNQRGETVMSFIRSVLVYSRTGAPEL